MGKKILLILNSSREIMLSAALEMVYFKKVFNLELYHSGKSRLGYVSKINSSMVKVTISEL